MDDPNAKVTKAKHFLGRVRRELLPLLEKELDVRIRTTLTGDELPTTLLRWIERRLQMIENGCTAAQLQKG